jgi:catechol 2,3-dioxygenase-like lactoylglutathione lyase family enzyme
VLQNYESVAFVATANAEAAERFYSTVLGLRLVATEPFALIFDLLG